MSCTPAWTADARPDQAQDDLVALLHRVAPAVDYVPTPVTQLHALGLDSLTLLSFFVELERSFRVSPRALRSVLCKSCTFGEICEIVRQSIVC